MEIRMLGPEDLAILLSADDEVFDEAVDEGLAAEFLADSRHHICAAVEDGVLVGFASAVDYIHPDKPRELWINEVSVAPGHRSRGVGRRIVARLIEHAGAIGCREAWVLTDDDNAPARALYRSAGGGERGVVMVDIEI